MGQLYYAQTQLYSVVLGVKFSGQYELDIAMSTTHFSEFIFFGSNSVDIDRLSLRVPSNALSLKVQGATLRPRSEVEDVRDH